MIREVDLVSYLPPFIAEYKEINTALAAENLNFSSSGKPPTGLCAMNSSKQQMSMGFQGMRK